MAKEYVSHQRTGYVIEDTRVSLDSVVYAFLRGESPEGIVESFPALTLEQVYGAVSYYLANREALDDYLSKAKEELVTSQSVISTITEPECLNWLTQRRIPADPYSSKYGPETFDRVPFIEQVRLPFHRTHVFERIVDRLESYESALLQCCDWAHYTPDEMAVFQTIRKAHGEDRWLIETPGHLFGRTERNLLAGMVSLIKYYGWTAYIYFDSGTTLLVWEGELLDLWAYDEDSFKVVVEILKGLPVSEKMAVPVHPPQLSPR